MFNVKYFSLPQYCMYGAFSQMIMRSGLGISLPIETKLDSMFKLLFGIKRNANGLVDLKVLCAISE